jgi:type I restriction enzyme S subunit
MNEWGKFSIADLISNGKLFIGDGYRAKNKELANHGIPFARISNINNGFHFRDADCFPEKDLHKVGNKISQEGDVVFTSKGTVGRFAFVKNDIPRFVYSPQLCFWRVLDNKIIDSRFLFFWMIGREFSLQINEVKGQTDMADYVSLADQRNMHITLPSIPEQHSIAEVLGALDDKIELNQQMNVTLEKTSWAIFKHIFIENELANKWEYSQIGEKLLTCLGGTPSTDKPKYWNNGTIPWINSGKVNEFRVIDGAKYITKMGLDNSSTKIVPARTTIIAITGATLGQVSLLEIEACTNQSVVSILGSDKLPNEYIYFWIKHTINALISWQTGGAQQHINKNNVNEFKILNPDIKTMQKFIFLVRPIFDYIKNNCFESLTLASLRDSLLPRLMSGEVRVKDVEIEL